ncbi:hypothetical protein ACWDV7_36220 [Streptomyces sp. NPDC003362]
MPAISAFPHHIPSNVRLVSLATGQEIKPGELIPEPYGHGHITYLGPTVLYTDDDPTPRPGGVAVVQYPEDGPRWAYLPSELNARYQQATSDAP